MWTKAISWSRAHLYLLLAIVITALFVVRAGLFVSRWGGIEHDSGWVTQVSRNLADHGIYATLSNTIPHGEGRGTFNSVHKGYSTQDESGNIYYSTRATVGPAFVLPQALTIKLFGNGYWQYRLFPLITYALLIGIILMIVFKFGGWVGGTITTVWLYLLPSFTFIQSAYESYAEPTALLYIMIGSVMFYLGRRRDRTIYYVLAGVFLSLTILTKLLFLVSVAPVAIYMGAKLLKNRRQFWAFVISLLAPIALFYIWMIASLWHGFGFEAVVGFHRDLVVVMGTGGSGQEVIAGGFGWSFVWAKLGAFKEIGLAVYPLVAIALVALPFFASKIFKSRHELFWPLYLALSGGLAWYLFLSSDGWGRHNYQALMLTIVFVSSALGVLWSQSNRYPIPRILSLGLLVAVMVPMINYSALDGKFIYRTNDISKLTTQSQSSIKGFPQSIMFALDSQVDATKFLNSLGGDEKLYYADNYLVAELSLTTGRVFYPLTRYEDGEGYLIFGPYQVSSQSTLPESYLPTYQQKFCEKIVFENNNYQVCRLKPSPEIEL